jgi:hypothetical protein
MLFSKTSKVDAGCFGGSGPIRPICGCACAPRAADAAIANPAQIRFSITSALPLDIDYSAERGF